jgi:hypothetical protein
LPRGVASRRPPRCGSGSVAKPQSYFGMFIGIDSAAGIWISSERSEPPNSSSSTREFSSSVSRFAKTQPAEPAPTTM